MMQLTFHQKTHTFEISLEKDKGNWLIEKLEVLSVSNEKRFTFQQLKADFETQFEDFELFCYSKPILILRQLGLLSL